MTISNYINYNAGNSNSVYGVIHGYPHKAQEQEKTPSTEIYNVEIPAKELAECFSQQMAIETLHNILDS